MEHSTFLYENLSYPLLFWLHYGAFWLISYGFYLYVIPIAYNIVLLLLPNFNYGFKKKEASEDKVGASDITKDESEIAASKGAGAKSIVGDAREINFSEEDVKEIKASKIFASVYSRNPFLFVSEEGSKSEKTQDLFKGLDKKLSDIYSSVKDLSKKDAKDSEIGLGIKPQSETAAGNQGNVYKENEKVEGKPELKGNSATDNGSAAKKSKKKSFLIYGNLLFFAAIAIINIYSFFYYNNIFNDYFYETEDIFKPIGTYYKLDYKKAYTIKDEEKMELLKKMSNYVEVINTVKYRKRLREKIEKEKEENNEGEK